MPHPRSGAAVEISLSPMGQPPLSSRVRSLRESSTIAISSRAKALRRAGVDVLSFAAGEPDFPTPPQVCEAAIKALNAGQTKYMPSLGDPEAREVVARKLVEENGVPGLTGEHVAITCGAKQALYSICQCLFDSGGDDEAILPVPSWVSYRPVIELAGGRVRELPCHADTGFDLDPEALRSAIGPRTRLLVLNTPSNPCSTMYSPERIRSIASVVHDSRDVAPDLVILSDEIYEKIIYGPHHHHSIGSIPEVAERTITVNGLSKAYSMTGWRAGYAACPGAFGLELIRAMGRLQGQMTSNITSFVYPAICTALTECRDEVEAMREAFAQRARIMHEGLTGLGLSCPRPIGAFYAFPDVSPLFGRRSGRGRSLESAHAIAEALIEEAGIATVPGEEFGGCGADHIRFSFACSEAQIEEGLRRFGAFMATTS